MRILRIGDPHIRLNNLEESEKLLHFINDKILELCPDRVEILGDLFHTHSIVRLEVLDFWENWIDVLTAHEDKDFYILRGNHDMSGSEESSISALLAFKHIKKPNLRIIEHPKTNGIYGYISYYSDNEKFIQIANSLAEEGAKVLVCHQTFQGSQYENGFYAPDGIDASRINIPLIISGHIHKHQILVSSNQTIIYPGTPKWDNASDANEDKGIWLYEHDDITGAILDSKLISTAGPCTPIIELTWQEGDKMPEIDPSFKNTIELVGSSKWIDKVKNDIKGKVALKVKITDRISKENRKVENTFINFVKHNFETNENKEKLIKYMKELNLV